MNTKYEREKETKEFEKTKETNIITLVGKKIGGLSFYFRDDTEVCRFKIITHDNTYFGNRYVNKGIKHNIVLRQPTHIETIKFAQEKDYLEVIGHLTYFRTLGGSIPEIIAHAITVRTDLRKTGKGGRPKGSKNKKTLEKEERQLPIGWENDPYYRDLAKRQKEEASNNDEERLGEAEMGSEPSDN